MRLINGPFRVPSPLPSRLVLPDLAKNENDDWQKTQDAPLIWISDAGGAIFVEVHWKVEPVRGTDLLVIWNQLQLGVSHLSLTLTYVPLTVFILNL